ncbi:uroporphyrinogen-III synthase [Psychrobacter sp. 2Y5]|uniref:uroporphyrinogen-III synthase n=1 Tax=unclassified Psychrobacter TaxID=196806 RepID=UPI003F45E980
MPTSMSRNLSPVVINTRPIERAAPLTEHLQDIGFAVVDMPMLTLQTRAVVDADIDIMRRWLAGQYQALVVVSPTAAQSGLAIWQALVAQEQAQSTEQMEVKSVHYDPPSSIIAVGDATADVLQAATKPVLQPLIANNEGMLAMAEIARLQAGDKLLVWRGLGGRRLLVDTLQARGVEIESIAWYERMMPDSAASDYAAWLASYLNQQEQASTSQPKPIVIISSGTAFEHWVSVVQQAGNKGALRLDDFCYVVLGVRLAEMVAAQQLAHIQVEDLSPETISTAINTP